MRIKEPTSRSAIERARHRFEHWRRTRPPGRSRIPARLWAAAVAAAREQGVHATSRLLRLDYAALRRRVFPTDESRSVTPPASPPTLIELRPATGLASSCVIEIESPCGGRVRVPVPPVTVSDLVALAHGVWRSGSASR